MNELGEFPYLFNFVVFVIMPISVAISTLEMVARKKPEKVSKKWHTRTSALNKWVVAPLAVICSVIWLFLNRSGIPEAFGF